VVFLPKLWQKHHLRSNPPVTCGLPTSYILASHQLLTGKPVIFYRQHSNIEVGAALLRYKGEQLQSNFSRQKRPGK
jgi:hypothetical protein